MRVKKLLASLLAATMALGMMSIPAFAEEALEEAQAPWDGTAVTEVIPDADGNYNIFNGAELAWIAQQVNSGKTDKIKIVLQNDIDLNGQEWTPIGGQNVFSGIFDGNSHAVKNLKVSRCDNPGYEDRSIGLIGYAVDVTVKNLKIENCEITGRYGLGAVVGEADGPILFENIEVLGGTITADKDSSGKIAQVAGGILGIGYGAGENYDGTIVFRNCVNYSNVTVNKQHAGGLWGSITYANNADVTVEGCYNYGNITSLSQDNGGYAGGLGGYFAAKTLTITDCINNGTVTANKYQGELVAYSTLEGGSIPSESVAARIDSTYYETLQDAVDAAQTGDTVTLLKNYTVATAKETEYNLPNEATLDLNQKTLTVPFMTAIFQSTENGTAAIKNGNVVSNADYALWIGGGTNYPTKIIVDNVNVTGGINVYAANAELNNVNVDASEKDYYAVWGDEGADILINSGTYTGGKNTAGNNMPAVLSCDQAIGVGIAGGTFNTDVSTYIASGYYQKANEDGTFVVLPSPATVTDTAKTTGAEVTLDGLHTNDAIEHVADAAYKVVLSTAPQADVEAANKAIAAEENSGSEKAIFDISVVKTDGNGTTTDISSSITNQQVTLTLGETPKADTVRVYHVTGGAAEKVAGVTVSGSKITFTAPSFSTYAVSYDAEAAAEEAVTTKVGVVFSPVTEGGNQYYITLKAMDSDKVINRFMSADLVFKNNGAGIGYDIAPAANMTVSAASVNDKSTEYHFEMNGTAASSATGKDITIGTITFSGYGTIDFSVDAGYQSGHAVNIVNTAKVSGNIVDHYMVNKENIAESTLVVNEVAGPTIAADESGTITGELNPATKDLTINIAFNNTIADNAAGYQQMKATISGGDLAQDIAVEFGGGLTENAYTLTQELTQNITYTVTIEGEGYRTVRYSVNMNTDKVLNFWNNVKDEAAVIEVGKDSSAVKTTFLAGDIVKDGIINLYDLSAVVSYFGTVNDVTTESAYAKYDLNRDGKIDSKDVAMVLVSWGN